MLRTRAALLTLTDKGGAEKPGRCWKAGGQSLGSSSVGARAASIINWRVPGGRRARRPQTRRGSPQGCASASAAAQHQARARRSRPAHGLGSQTLNDQGWACSRQRCPEAGGGCAGALGSHLPGCGSFDGSRSKHQLEGTAPARAALATLAGQHQRTHARVEVSKRHVWASPGPTGAATIRSGSSHAARRPWA